MSTRKINIVFLSFLISVSGLILALPQGANAKGCPGVTGGKKFFKTVRSKVHKKISAAQFESYNCIFKYWRNENLSDKRWLAYAMATAWHESRMRPIREGSGGHKKAVWAAKFAWKKGWTKRRYDLPHPKTGKVYYGRGLVQITWAANYLKVGRKIGMGDRLFKNPELALQPDIATKLMFHGMQKGLYRVEKRKSIMRKCGGPVKRYVRAKLGLYFNGRCNESYRARNMINGDLRKTANKIKKYARHYRSGLSPVPVSLDQGRDDGSAPPTGGTAEPTPGTDTDKPVVTGEIPKNTEIKNDGPVIRPYLPGEKPDEKLGDLVPVPFGTGSTGGATAGTGTPAPTPAGTVSEAKPETVDMVAHKALETKYKALESKNVEQTQTISSLEATVLDQTKILEENRTALENANTDLTTLGDKVKVLETELADLKQARSSTGGQMATPSTDMGASTGQSGAAADAGGSSGQSGQTTTKPEKPTGWFATIKSYVWKN